jgi:hypothetical protein
VYNKTERTKVVLQTIDKALDNHIFPHMSLLNSLKFGPLNICQNIEKTAEN